MIKKVFKNSHPVYLLVIAVAIYMAAHMYWSTVCIDGGCSSFQKDVVLRPAIAISQYFAVAVIPFIFLPGRYFKGWLLWCLSWTSVLLLWAMSTVEHGLGGMISFSRSDYAELWFRLLVVVTIVFIAVRYYLDQRKTS